ncbi:MarR family winged helix-turn-helix transcriptional regulator [Actinomadura rupiterrae]|uniref:MarR family winged helix-turn-helix transcriptional regulator n=1 Tax=Actinomadura rupiterrae TaxID=559627 RepID=UPI0020A5DAE3|nr:MarR family transcriptional regulator [Actinomadura rupiterrae]MCP2338193.1 DNA-binding MarR family transcriptional regulator [Actinomadura rupiterrae]
MHRPASDTRLDSDICKLAHRLTQRLDAHARAAADDLDLTPAQVIALRELTEPITARELAHRMVCEPPNATFVIDRLEKQGLIERRPHPTDRRAKQIVLTGTGHQRRAEVLDRLAAHTPLTALTPDQQDTLRTLLQTLVP